MRTAAARERKPTDVSRVAAGKRFGRYKGETERAIRKADVKEDETVARLIEAWESHDVRGNRMEKEYDKVHTLLEGLGISAEDIELFSVALTDFLDEKRFPAKAGLFLSAMINLSKDEPIALDVTHIPVKLRFLGIKNRKDVIVTGDLGEYSFERMEGGSVVVHGSTKRAGHGLKGGSLTIHGNVRGDCGAYMEGGSIHVKGEAGSESIERSIGHKMSGGRIAVEGYGGSWVGYGMKGGSITVKKNVNRGLGTSMGGGSITVMGRALVDVGERMSGGEITVHKTAISVGREMTGGRINIKERATVAGEYMRGGIIRITGRCRETVSDLFLGGAIFVNDVRVAGKEWFIRASRPRK
jgi:formylmethanofuran dehydrogenase subunit C